MSARKKCLHLEITSALLLLCAEKKEGIGKIVVTSPSGKSYYRCYDYTKGQFATGDTCSSSFTDADRLDQINNIEAINRTIPHIKTPPQKSEFIAKRLAYLDFGLLTDKPEGIAIQQFLAKENLKVGETFDNIATGFQALTLVNDQDKKAKLVFRGTNEDLDWASNMGEEVGRSQFEPEREKIQKLLQEYKDKGYSIEVSGHSLGGALAQITAAELPDLIDEVKTFNSAGIKMETAKKLLGKDKSVEHFLKVGDVVQDTGTAYIPGKPKVFRFKDGVDGTPHRSLMTVNLTLNGDPIPPVTSKYRGETKYKNPHNEEVVPPPYFQKKTWQTI